jgi:multiple sugar transport system permease protein/sn-glycerol 3-phosphate transport system permease protein
MGSAADDGSGTGEAFRRLPSLGVVALHAVLILLCLLTAFPLLWMLSTALKPLDEIFARDLRLIPSNPTLENFPEAFRLQPVGRWLLNSVVVAVAITIGKLALSVPAAYAFARFRFFGRNLLFALVVGTMIVPDVITIVPNYVLVARFDWINTPQGVIVPMVAFTGFYVFLLRQALLSLPQELFDAARVDGAGEWTILWRVALPLVRPAVAVVAVLSFLSAWNLYLWPLLVLSDTEAQTLTVGMRYFAQSLEMGTPTWGALMAVATLAILPPLLLYVLAQKAIISAFVESGFK